jgi:hypothetical protein
VTFSRPKGRPVLYPNHYTWLVFAAAMDIMMTYLVLWKGGREANFLAEAVLRRFGMPGMVLFKFLLVAFVISVCEIVGRKNIAAGKILAKISIVLTWIPVAISFALLA